MDENLTTVDTREFLKLAKSSADGVPLVSMLAYTGGAVRLSSHFWPVIFDLSSTVSAKTVPLLHEHNPDTVVGHADDVDIKQTRIRVSGKLSGSNEKTEEIKASSKNGMKWQVSVGLASKKIEFVDSQSTVKVNGRSFAGPVYVARDNVLREVSITALGADSDTEASIAASYYTGGIDVNFEEWVTKQGFDPNKLTDDQKTNLKATFDRLNVTATNPPNNPPTVPPVNPPTPTPVTQPSNNPGLSQTNPDPVTDMRATLAAERQRIDAINLLAARYNNPTENDASVASVAIRDNWTVERTELHMLRNQRPTVSVASSYNNIASDRNSTYQVLAAGLALTGRLPNPERHFNTQVLESAQRTFRAGLSIQEFLLRAAQTNGFNGSPNVRDESNLREMLRAAFSTFDVPTILSNNANLNLIAGFNAVDQSWRQIARRRPVTDFKEVTNLRVIGGFTFEIVAPDGRIKHGTLEESPFTNKARTYGKMLAITRQDIINDSLSAFNDLPRALGRGGALGLVKAFWTEFMDNSTFFTAGNNNVSAGALSIAGLDAQLAVFRKLKDPGGEYIMHQPEFLVVPSNLEGTARQLVNSSTLITGEDITIPNGNQHAGQYKVIAPPYLNDPAFEGNSTTAYYMLGSPEDIPVIEVVFLNGRDTPFVDTAEADFSQLGMQMRAYYDWGVKKQDPAGGVRSTGV